jgi:hypothetical protein
MPFRKEADEALSQWRAADHQMALLTPRSAGWIDAYRAAELAKARYQAAVEGARAAQSPEPPPFSEVSAPRSEEEADVTTLTPPESDGQMYGG